MIGYVVYVAFTEIKKLWQLDKLFYDDQLLSFILQNCNIDYLLTGDDTEVDTSSDTDNENSVMSAKNYNQLEGNELYVQNESLQRN